MNTAQQVRALRLTFLTRHCSLRPGEVRAMEEAVSPLEAAVAAFPTAELRSVVSYAARSDEYHVRMTLTLPGRELFTGGHDSLPLPAYEHCVRKLARKAEAYRQRHVGKEAASRTPQPGPRRAEPSGQPSFGRVRDAVADGDYGAFRAELSGFDPAVRRRIGRWMQQDPELDAAFGETSALDDFVEEVMLCAFERFRTRPDALRLGDWLESLTAPAMRSLLHDPDEATETAGYVRTLRGMTAADDDPADAEGFVPRKPR